MKKLLTIILIICCVITSFPVVSEAKEAVAKLESRPSKDGKYYVFAPKNCENRIVYRLLHVQGTDINISNTGIISITNLRPTVNNNSMVLYCPGWVNSLTEYQQFRDRYTEADSKDKTRATYIIVSEYGTPVEYFILKGRKVVKTIDLIDPFTAQDMMKISKKAERIWKKKQPTYIAPYVRDYSGSVWMGYDLDQTSETMKAHERLPIKKYQYDSKYFYDQIGCFEKAVETLFPGKFREFWEFHIGFDARESSDELADAGPGYKWTPLDDSMWDYYYTRIESANQVRGNNWFWSLSFGDFSYKRYQISNYYKDVKNPEYMDADDLYEFYQRFRNFYVHDHIHMYECTYSYELPYKVRMSEFAEQNPDLIDEYVDEYMREDYESLFADYFPEYDSETGYCKKCSYKNCPYKNRELLE